MWILFLIIINAILSLVLRTRVSAWIFLIYHNHYFWFDVILFSLNYFLLMGRKKSFQKAKKKKIIFYRKHETLNANLETIVTDFLIWPYLEMEHFYQKLCWTKWNQCMVYLLYNFMLYFNQIYFTCTGILH